MVRWLLYSSCYGRLEPVSSGNLGEFILSFLISPIESTGVCLQGLVQEKSTDH